MFILKPIFCIMLLFEFGYCDSIQNSPETHPNLALLSEACGKITHTRTLGGQVTDLYEFPWLALIAYKTGDGQDFLAGGSIINSRYILTAGHAVRNETIRGVRIGEYNLETKTDCVGDVCEDHIQDIRVEETIVHEDFNIKTDVNDIALLRLEQPIDFSFKNAAPICLPVTQELRSPLEEGNQALVAGWELHAGRRSLSATIQSATVSVISENNCKKIFEKRTGPLVLDTQFCYRGYKNYCAASGFPLIAVKKHNNVDRYVQYGIVTRGSRCSEDSTVICSDVSKHMDWILNHIRA